MNQRFVRYKDCENNIINYGIIEDDNIFQLDNAPWLVSSKTGKKLSLESVVLSAPVNPSKIICIGLNYRAHVEASYSTDSLPEYPLIFLKPPSAIIGHEQHIVHPKQSERVDYEAELGVVIGKKAKNISENQAEDFIFGFTCVNDVTARDLQKKDGQWSRAKGFDTFCPVGPWIVKNIDYPDVLVEGIVNKEIKQSGRTSSMIFKIPYLISYLSSIMTLNPGDLIATGTPAGIAPMKAGDVIEIRIEQIGSLKNIIVKA
ncbi:MAG: fumarylacetoacetate hydrolase family protein [Candidatus Zixiibacteriota bacterium]